VGARRPDGRGQCWARSQRAALGGVSSAPSSVGAPLAWETVSGGEDSLPEWCQCCLSMELVQLCVRVAHLRACTESCLQRDALQ